MKIILNKRIILISVKPLVMAKWFSILLFSFMIGNNSFSQNNSLIAEGKSPDLYLIHTVTPKENFYSLGRMYNISPKAIAAYNNLKFENGLEIGQTLKIPLTATNFTQAGKETEGEVFIAVYHLVQPKESLYKVSSTYNKVLISSLKKWNHLKSNEVSEGIPLVIGYLKVSKKESPLAAIAGKPFSQEPTVTKESTKQEPIPAVVNAERLPPVKKPDEEPVEKKEPVVVTNNAPLPSNEARENKSIVNFSGGYFKKLFEEQSAGKSPVNATGSAGVFKSTSGWNDGKYYCFNNDVAPGSVIKITNSINGKFVYAKVLDAIPDIKQNTGLAIIISNAAAEELGTGENKFDCALSYVK